MACWAVVTLLSHQHVGLEFCILWTLLCHSVGGAGLQNVAAGDFRNRWNLFSLASRASASCCLLRHHDCLQLSGGNQEGLCCPLMGLPCSSGNLETLSVPLLGNGLSEGSLAGAPYLLPGR